MPSRISIVSGSHPSRNPRAVKEAFTLARAGYEVTLITVASHPASAALDRRLLADAPFQHRFVDQLDRRAAARIASFGRRIETWLSRKLNRRLNRNLVQAMGPLRALRNQAMRVPADLAIVHTEAGAWVGTELLRRGWRVAADFEDWYSEDLPPAARAHLPLRRLRAIEGGLLERAAYVCAPSEAMADALHRQYRGQRPIVITNSFPLRPPVARPHSRTPQLVWFSQTIGPGRGLEAFFSAWARNAVKPPVTLVGACDTMYQNALLARLPEAVLGYISFQAPVPADELPSLLERFDIGLALEPKEPRSRNLTISNKVLQYLNASLAIIASDTVGQQEVLRRAPDAGVIVPFEDADLSACTLQSLWSDSAALRRRQAAARRLAEDVYCWEKEAPRLLSAVAQSLASPRP